MNNYFTNMYYTLKYKISRKSEPVFNDYAKIITNFSELDSKTRSPFNLSGGVEYFDSGPTPNGLFTCERMTEEEQQKTYNDYVDLYTAWGINPIPEPIERWKWKSDACNSWQKFRIDIYKPGRIVTKCTLPNYGCVSPWIFIAMQKLDFNNQWLLEIDRPTVPRDYYFEIDTIETFVKEVGFNVHYGVPRQNKHVNICQTFNETEYHYPEVRWDGKGNWKWYLDSVLVSNQTVTQPEDVYPYFKLTYGVFWNQQPPSYINKMTWKVDWVKFSDNLITDGLSLPTTTTTTEHTTLPPLPPLLPPTLS